MRKNLFIFSFGLMLLSFAFSAQGFSFLALFTGLSSFLCSIRKSSLEKISFHASTCITLFFLEMILLTISGLGQEVKIYYVLIFLNLLYAFNWKDELSEGYDYILLGIMAEYLLFYLCMVFIPTSIYSLGQMFILINSIFGPIVGCYIHEVLKTKTEFTADSIEDLNCID